MYTLAQAASLYNTSLENARRWCLEFSAFLSDNANPPEHRKRLLDDDDLAVFALVAEMRARGLVLDAIKEALQRGDRGSIPANPAAVVPADKSRLARLQSDVNRLTEALQVTMDENKALKGENKALHDELEAAKRELREAYKEVGRRGG